MDNMISSRYEFHKLIKENKLKETGVEIGVGRGEFSKYLLESTELVKIYSVDPWDMGKSYYRSKWTQEKLNEVYEMAKQNLQSFGERSEILKKTSVEASQLFDEKSIDFVYIDALHDYQSVVTDIKLWWPKVKAGGILAGHDYTKRIDEKEKDAEFGVIRAVDEAVKELNVDLHTTDKDRFPSWYFKKPFAIF